MKRMKRTLSWLLSFALLLSCVYIPVSATAAPAFTLSIYGIAGENGVEGPTNEEIDADAILNPGDFFEVRVGTTVEELNAFTVLVKCSNALEYQSGYSYKITKPYKITIFSGGSSIMDTIEDANEVTWQAFTVEPLQKGVKIAGAYSNETTPNLSTAECSTLVRLVYKVKDDAEIASASDLIWLEEEENTQITHSDSGETKAYDNCDYSAKIVRAIGGSNLPVLDEVSLANDQAYVDSEKVYAYDGATVGDEIAAKTIQATAASAGGNNVTDKVAWSVSPTGKGVSISSAGLLAVSETAEAGSYTVKAEPTSGKTLGDAAGKTATFTVTRAAAELSEIKVLGANDAEFAENASVTVNGTDVALTVSGFDQYGTAYDAFTVAAKTGETYSDAQTSWVSGNTVTIPGTTADGTPLKLTVTDTAGGHSATAARTLTIARAASAATTIRISGDDILSKNPSGDTTATYTATVYDQFGDDVSSTNTVNWYLSASSVSGVRLEISNNTAVLTVPDTVVTPSTATFSAHLGPDWSTATVKCEKTVSIVSLTFPSNITVTTKENPTYGDSWNDIVTGVAIGTDPAADITADGIAYTAKLGENDVAGKLYLADAAQTPDAGEQTAAFYFSATEGTTYQNIPVPAANVIDAGVTVAKASFTPTVSLDGWTYGETAKTPSVADNTSEGGVTYAYKPANADDTAYTDAAPTAAGEYTVRATVEEEGNYNSATATANFTIARKTITPTVTLEPTTGVYSGSDLTPSVTVKDGATELVKDVDYTLAWTKDGNPAASITEVGTYTVTATGADSGSNYSFTTATATFTVTAATQSALTVSDVAGKTYGDADFTVTVGGGDGTGAYTLSSDSNAVQISGGTGGVFTVSVQAAASSVTLTAGRNADANHNAATAVTKSFAISPKPVTLTWPTQTSYPYTGSAQGITATFGESSGVLSADTEKLSVSLSGHEALAVSPTAYNARATLNGTAKDNYTLSNPTWSYTITKAASTVDTHPAANTLTYTGSAQALVTTGSATGGTMQYRLGTEGDFGTDIPTATEAGDYTVYYKVAGDDNHSDTSEASVTVSIARAVIEVPAQSGTLTYTGSAQSPEWTVTDGWTTTDSVSETNAGTYTVSATPDANHKWSDGTAAKEITWTIGKATYDGTVPTVSKNVYWNASEKNVVLTSADFSAALSLDGLSLSTADGATASVVEGFADVSSLITPNKDNGGFTLGAATQSNVGGKARYTLKIDSTNYQTFETTVTVTIVNLDNSATVTISNAPTDNKLVYGNSWTVQAASTQSGAGASFAYTWYSDSARQNVYAMSGANNATVPATTPVGTYYLTVVYTDADAHAGYPGYTGSAEYTLTVEKANAVLNTAPAANTLTYTGSAQALVTAGSATGGAVQYRLGTEGDFGADIPTATEAGSYTVYYKVKGDDNHNDVAVDSVPVTIARAVIEVPAQSGTLTYNGGAQSPTWTVTSGWTVSAGSTVETNAGTYTVSATPDANHKWSDGVAAKSLTWAIGELAVTVDGITAENKTYDGTMTATLVYTNATFTGILTGDTLTVSATGSFADKNVGSAKTVTLSGLTLGGTDAGNYELAGTGNQTSTTATIHKKPLAVTGITAENKEYDGSTTATLVYTGVKFNNETIDGLTVSATGTFADAALGSNKAVSISDIALENVDSGNDVLKNYELASTGNQTSTTATITGKLLRVSGITAENKTYDGTTNATLVYTGVQFADKDDTSMTAPEGVTVTAEGSFDTADVGTGKTVAIRNIALGGANAGSYALDTTSGAQQTSTTANVTVLALSSDNLTATVTSASPSFDGAQHEPTLTYAWNGTAPATVLPTSAVLTYAVGDQGGTTYTGTLSEGKPVGAGTYLVTATFDGNYTGSVTAVYTILPADNTKAVVTLDVPGGGYTYDGSAKTPAVTVKASSAAGAATLVEGTDYDKAYSHNINVGSALVTITFKGNYAAADAANNTRTVSFAIAPRTITDGDVSLDSSAVYTGSAITPTVTVSGIAASDYTVVYADNIDVGTASVTVRGQGNYTGVVTKSFAITSADASSATVTLLPSGATYTYDGTAKTPKARVTLGGKTLKDGVDYSLSYSGNVDVGTASVTVTYLGNYSGSSSASFTIGQAALSSETVGTTVTPASGVYSGAEQTPELVVTYGGATLVKGTDYTVAWSPASAGDGVTPGVLGTGSLPQSAGDYTATVTFTGNYSGTATAGYHIELAARSFRVSPASVTLQKTEGIVGTQQLAVSDTASGATPSFLSSDTGVATVSDSGLITAVGAGTATITVTPGTAANYAAVTPFEVAVTVTEQAVQTLTLANSSAVNRSVVYGENDNSYTLTVTASAGETERKADVTYSTDNASVATVEKDTDGTATLKIVGAGTAKIGAALAQYRPDANTTYLAASTDFTVTVTPKPVTVSWDVSGASAYTGSEQSVTATIPGLLTADAGKFTLSGNTATDAGSYTAAVTMNSAVAGNYALTDATKAWSIAKAAGNISIDNTTVSTLTKGANVTLSPTDPGSAERSLTYTSSDPAVLAVNRNGVMSAKGNGTATVTIGVPESKNYLAGADVVVTVTTVVASSLNKVSPATSNKSVLASDVSDTTMTLSGLVDSGDATGVVLNYVDASGAARTLTLTFNETTIGDQTTYTLKDYKIGDGTATDVTGNTITVDGIAYTVDTSALAKAPVMVTVAAGETEVVLENSLAPEQKTAAATVAQSIAVNDEELIAAAATSAAAAETAAASFVNGAGSTDEEKANAEKTAANNAAKQVKDSADTTWMKTITYTDGSDEVTKPNFEVTMEVSVKVDVSKYEVGGSHQSVVMNLTPQFKLVAKMTDDQGNVLTGESAKSVDLTAAAPLSNEATKNSADKVLDNDMSVTVTMPGGFQPAWALHFPSYVTETQRNGADAAAYADRWMRISYSGNQATFRSRWFSYYGFEDNNNTATVVYHYLDGSTSAPQVLTAADIGALPLDETTTAERNGWRIGAGDAYYTSLIGGATSDSAHKLGLSTLSAGQENGTIESPLHLYSNANRVVNLSVSGGSYGSVSLIVDGQAKSGSSVKVPIGATVSVTATPTSGGVLKTFTPSGVSTSNGADFTMPDNDVTFTVVFESNGSDGSDGSGDSGGSGGVSTAANVTAAGSTGNGRVKLSTTHAAKGETVTITVTPDKGYKVASVTVKDNKGNTIAVTANADGTYSFTMPSGTVTVTTVYEKADSAATRFTDVAADAYYADAVAWAVANGVTNGVTETTFAPNAGCTRAQAVTFLYRAAGSPEVTTEAGFADVAADSYYAKAVAWAVANGITNGVSETEFAPDAICTRAQIVTFLSRFEKAAAGDASKFADVTADAYYAGAVGWAVANGITNGVSDTEFAPDAVCTRAQIVTFLYRDFVK